MRGSMVLSAAAFVVVLWVASSVSAQTLSEPVYRHLGFARGDSNIDGTVNFGDALTLLSSLFLGIGSLPCEAAADADANARLDVSDGIFLMSYISFGAQEPSAPFPGCAAGATGGLGCAEETCPEVAGRSFTLFGDTFEADSVVFAIGRSPMMVPGQVRDGLVEQLKEAIAALPNWLPFDVVNADGGEAATLSSSGTPSVTLSTGQQTVNSALDQLFETQPQGDDLEALLTTAIECARRGSGEQVVIYIGDGWDLSFGEPDLMREPGRRARLRVLRAIQLFNATAPVKIHTIGVNRYNAALEGVMSGIAVQNGGSFTSGGTRLSPPTPSVPTGC